MATLLWQRDLTSDVNNVKSTYSSWDSCMTKSYCKWPAIIGIIIGALIVASILFCLFRCCGCLSCLNACCPSGRKRRQNQGYEQPYYQQPPPQPYQQPYHSHAPPNYAGGGYRGPQTATFEVPSKKGAQKPASYNEDALPAMPGWDTATTRHVEEEPEDVEMEKLDHTNAQQESLLAKNDGGRYYGQQQQEAAGDLGTMHAGPYHDYNQHQQFVPSPVSTARNSAYPPTYRTSPTSTVYEPDQQWGAGRGYAPSLPPSYHTGPPSIASPPPQHQKLGSMGRKPVQGSWRDV